MPYGSYDGPDKPDKGRKHGSCNRTRCQDAPADWYNHGSYAWYCRECKDQIYDFQGRMLWERDFPNVDHPMFETEAMMAARNAATPHTR